MENFIPTLKRMRNFSLCYIHTSIFESWISFGGIGLKVKVLDCILVGNTNLTSLPFTFLRLYSSAILPSHSSSFHLLRLMPPLHFLFYSVFRINIFYGFHFLVIFSMLCSVVSVAKVFHQFLSFLLWPPKKLSEIFSSFLLFKSRPPFVLVGFHLMKS